MGQLHNASLIEVRGFRTSLSMFLEDWRARLNRGGLSGAASDVERIRGIAEFPGQSKRESNFC